MTHTQHFDRPHDTRLHDFLAACLSTAERALDSGDPEEATGALASILERARELSAAPRVGHRRAFTSRLSSATAPR
ncbi:MAG: hypothetical protein K8S98_06090 [Planctomycetes bacterium]|nr:hypothetical protein [Planctomycetota bacterium]